MKIKSNSSLITTVPSTGIIADIEQARYHIHLLYWLFLAADETGRKVVDALARAVKRGVQCRVLMVAVGSKLALRKLAPKMRAQGIEVQAMLPVNLFRRNTARFDLRNHRKIAVIDGRIGYTGSQNIVNAEFVRGYPNEEMMLRVTGPVVVQLQAVFLADKYFETGGLLEHPELFPDVNWSGPTVAQVLPSGPGYQRENGQELMVALLYSARGAGGDHHALFCSGRTVPASGTLRRFARRGGERGAFRACESTGHAACPALLL